MRRRRDFFWFYVTKPVKSVNFRDWTGLLTQRIDPDHFVLWHPSVIARAESTIAGAELSIGGGGGPRATPKVYKLTPMVRRVCKEHGLLLSLFGVISENRKEPGELDSLYIFRLNYTAQP